MAEQQTIAWTDNKRKDTTLSTASTPEQRQNHSLGAGSKAVKGSSSTVNFAGERAIAVDPVKDDWDYKLATLFSIFENSSEDSLRNALEETKGDLESAIPLILNCTLDHRATKGSNLASPPSPSPSRKKQKLRQPRLSAFLPSPTGSVKDMGAPTPLPNINDPHKDPNLPSLNDRLRWKDTIEDGSRTTSSTTAAPARVKPLVLYSPKDVAKHAPCTLLLNVLDKDLSHRLLKVMLEDSETWNRNRWWLFERMVESPHKTSYFAEAEHDVAEVSAWTYNGMKQDPPRTFLKEMDEAKLVVRRIVNDLRNTREIHPYEVQGDWNCNVAAVNHYAHSKESVGWHADKLTYLGPRPTIASLTLGATRFFRIRKVIPDVKNPDTAGQLISISLPHNSLCIMWPPMQEEWKHEIPPQATVTPHPISGTARINITYRLRRPGFTPRDTPVCKCGVAMVLRCVFKNKANYGRYFFMCYGAGSQEGKTCGEFHWVDMEEKLAQIEHEQQRLQQLERKESEVVDAEAQRDNTHDHGMPPIQDRGDLDLAYELDDSDLQDITLQEIDEADLLE